MMWAYATQKLEQPRSFRKLQSVGSSGVMDNGHCRWAAGWGQIIKCPVSLTKAFKIHSESSGETRKETESQGETWSECVLESHSRGSELRCWPLDRWKMDGRGTIIWRWNGAGPGDQWCRGQRKEGFGGLSNSQVSSDASKWQKRLQEGQLVGKRIQFETQRVYTGNNRFGF